MRIVSYDKRYSVEMERISIEVIGNAIIGEINPKKRIPLGVYADDERAEWVFRDLHECYANKVVTCYSLGNEGDILLSDYLQNTNTPISSSGGDFVSAHEMGDSSIYYMPEL